MKKDYRSTHALILGIVFVVGAPIGFAATFFSFHCQFNALSMDNATWTIAQQYIPHFVFGALFGVTSLVCWFGLRRGARWSEIVWLCVTSLLAALGLLSFASNPDVIMATKCILYILITWIAYRGFTNKKSEQADAANPHAFGTFVTHPADAGSAPKASGDT